VRCSTAVRLTRHGAPSTAVRGVYPRFRILSIVLQPLTRNAGVSWKLHWRDGTGAARSSRAGEDAHCRAELVHDPREARPPDAADSSDNHPLRREGPPVAERSLGPGGVEQRDEAARAARIRALPVATALRVRASPLRTVREVHLDRPREPGAESRLRRARESDGRGLRHAKPVLSPSRLATRKAKVRRRTSTTSACSSAPMMGAGNCWRWRTMFSRVDPWTAARPRSLPSTRPGARAVLAAH
jgi:hypothetical protein